MGFYGYTHIKGQAMIERDYYYQKLEPFINKPLIKIISGIRRSGKSTLLKLINNRLLSRGVVRENIIYINFESMAHYDIRASKDLYDHIMQKCRSGERFYLLFDEIQLVAQWEEAVNSFLVDLNADIYITGSNSNLLSSELSTLLTGRYIQFRLFPLSYGEMVTFRKTYLPEEKEVSLWTYIRRGGFPSLHIADYDETTSYTLLNDIYDSIVLRDVVDRFKIRDVELLNRVMRYVIDNVGNTFSAKNIADYFKSQFRKVDINTVYNHLASLESSYLISRVNRYDLVGKEILRTQEKFFLADQGIQHAVYGYRDRNISGILENIVYNELLRRGYQVYIGKFRDREIDFIAEKKQEKVYLQVAYKLESESTVTREFAPLLSLKDHYPKYVVSMDDHFHDNINGVRHVRLEDFLLSREYV